LKNSEQNLFFTGMANVVACQFFVICHMAAWWTRMADVVAMLLPSEG